MQTSEFLNQQPTSNRVKYFIISLLGSVAITLLFSMNLMAQGNLMVFPRRVVFEGIKRSQDLNIANTGTDTARYNISAVQFRMKENGEFEEITQPDSGEYFADKYIRFFPRTVVLPPNAAQVVKIQLMKAKDMLPGEYRSHLYFRAVPPEKPLGEKEAPKDTTSISIKIIPIFGITIPVIIRVGESTAKVNISDVSFEMVNDTIPTLKMAFNRTGNMSVYGEIAIEHISPQGKVTQLSSIQGMAVYTPIPVRRFKVDLDKSLGIDYHRGKIHIVYTSQSTAQPEKLAEANLLLH